MKSSPTFRVRLGTQAVAQGCILPLSVEDSRQMRASLKEPLAQQAIWSAERALSQQDAVAYAKAVTYPLIDPNHPAHNGFVETLLKNVSGNERILGVYASALPTALTIVAQQTADITGLVHGSSGKGASALTRNLAHRVHGDAFAYELLGTAELIRMNRVDNRGSQSTNGGPELRIFDTDRVDLGVRLPARGPREDGLERMFNPAGTGANKYRQTFEADAFLFRGDHTVGIDYKHVRAGGYYKGDAARSQSQLEAIANGILANDAFQLREFHFVTNQVFGADFVRAVERVNDQITAITGDLPPISLHEHVQFPLD